MDQFKGEYGNWALIAGAAEGIGAGFTRLLAQRGVNIVMVDNKLDAMQRLTDQIQPEWNVEVRQIHIDLALPEAHGFLLQSIDDLDCRLLIYVAAYSKVKPFLTSDREELETYIRVNNLTPVQLIHGFAIRLKEKNKSGGIILISSLAGLLGPPLVAPYAASKGFLIRLAESLSSEFSQSDISVMACCAGLTTTPTYYENTPEKTRKKVKAMDPDEVATYALRQLGRKPVCIPGWKNRFNYFILLRLFPRFISMKILSRTMRSMYESAN
ncbi:MAG: SDR family NAD(P)-dependent oxidoreductase [Bacteroidales bacterium]|nr:SDR family NAD(P)-dependent oxidoreductase [Bacteroidales bacterium]